MATFNPPATAITNAGGTVSIDGDGAVHVTPADGQNTNIAGGALEITASAVIDGDFADSKAVDGHRFYVGSPAVLKGTIDANGYNGPIGGTTPAAVAVTKLTANGTGAETIAATFTDNVTASLHIRPATGGVILGTDAGGQIYFATSGNASGDRKWHIAANGDMSAVAGETFTAGSIGIGSSGQILVGPAPNTLAQRNGANAQGFQLYNTYTDASNYERGEVAWGANAFYIGTSAAGTGVSRSIIFFNGGVERWTINSSGHFLATGAYNITTTGTVAIGGGTAIAKVLSAAATLNFGSILAAASADLTITVTGAAVGDAVDLGCPAAPDASIVYNAFVSAADTVTVRAFNVGAIADDPASATYRVAVLHF